MNTLHVSSLLVFVSVCSALELDRGRPLRDTHLPSKQLKKSFRRHRENGRAPGSEASRRPSRPHIIFVLADDLGWHDLGYTGGDIPTPTIDKLASEGIKLTNYYVLPTCAPTRASLLTGVSPLRHGVMNPYGHDVRFGLPRSLETMAEVLGKAGYETHMVGKWHLGFWQESYTPTFRGFRSFYGFYGMGEGYWNHLASGFDVNHKEPAYDFRRDEGARCGIGCSIVEDVRGKYGTTLLNQRAKEVVQQHDSNKPLFLYFAWQAVHAPRNSCPGRSPVPLPNDAGDYEYNGTRNAVFACMLRMADDGLSDLVEALETKNMLQDTIIVFSSDNGGPISTEKQEADDIGSSNWPLRGGKHTLFEGGTRTRSFVWAGWYSWSSSYHGLMGVSDWLPTLATMANAKFSDGLDGKNQWAAMTMGAESPHDHLVTAITINKFDGGNEYNWALRRDNWKLVLGRPGWRGGWSGPSGSVLNLRDGKILPGTRLYDLSSDEREQEDLSEKRPDKIRELLSVLLPYQLQARNESVVCVSAGSTRTIQMNLGRVWAPARG